MYFKIQLCCLLLNLEKQCPALATTCVALVHIVWRYTGEVTLPHEHDNRYVFLLLLYVCRRLANHL